MARDNLTPSNSDAYVAELSRAAQPVESRAAKTIREIFESGRPLTYICSAEEKRVTRVLCEVSRGLLGSGPVPVWTWSITEGVNRDTQASEARARTPRGALDFIVAHKAPAIFQLKDFHEPLRESLRLRRRLRDVYESCLGQQKFVVITAPVRFIPDEIERSIVYLELRPPDALELMQFLRGEVAQIPECTGTSDAILYQIALALRGLTLDEAWYALRRALRANPTLGPESVAAVLEEKRLLVNRSGFIEYVGGSTSLAEVGGLERLKSWLLERRKLFQLRDSLSEEIVPKGVLIMGIPGCGKSLSVKAIASCFQLPLYRIDMTEIFSGRHGKPEAAFVAACRMMEEMAPAVLWFDEIEMGISSTNSGGEQGRIFAFFLTWMQEKARGLFVAATANRIDLLPAEMIRKGRFDEVFFVDLPLPSEQAEIFKIHLSHRGVDVTDLDLAGLGGRLTKGWSGAEIEQCVVSAITKARLENRPLTARDLTGIAAKVIPLSRTMQEQIGRIRSWAFERAVRASPDQFGR